MLGNPEKQIQGNLRSFFMGPSKKTYLIVNENCIQCLHLCLLKGERHCNHTHTPIHPPTHQSSTPTPLPASFTDLEKCHKAEDSNSAHWLPSCQLSYLSKGFD